MKWRLLAVACGVIALGLLLYPLLGELLNERYHSDVETVYTNAIEDANWSMSENSFAEAIPLCADSTAWVPAPPTGREVPTTCPTVRSSVSAPVPCRTGRYTPIFGMSIVHMAPPTVSCSA